jgi:hypothetical protein
MPVIARLLVISTGAPHGLRSPQSDLAIRRRRYVSPSQNMRLNMDSTGFIILSQLHSPHKRT